MSAKVVLQAKIAGINEEGELQLSSERYKDVIKVTVAGEAENGTLSLFVRPLDLLTALQAVSPMTRGDG